VWHFQLVVREDLWLSFALTEAAMDDKDKNEILSKLQVIESRVKQTEDTIKELKGKIESLQAELRKSKGSIPTPSY
jgi:peptidoglycan hydrolase CwlO-like protein